MTIYDAWLRDNRTLMSITGSGCFEAFAKMIHTTM